MKNVRTSIGLVAFIVVALCIATSASAKKGGKPGGGSGGTAPVCFRFQDGASDRIGSDLGVPYCNNKKAKVEAILTQDGHLALKTNKSERPGYGRSLFVDWSLGPEGDPCPLEFGDPPQLPGGVTFCSTDDLDIQGIPHWGVFSVAGFNDSIDLRSMQLYEVRTDVNVRLTVVAMPDDPYEPFRLRTRFEPYGLIDFRSCPAENTPIDLLEVTCDGEDAAGQCDRWTVRAYPEDLACTGLTYQTDNESYRLPFTLEVWVMD